MASVTLFSQIHIIDIFPNPLSDHGVVISQFALAGTPTEATRWRLTTMLIKDNSYCDHFRNTFLKCLFQIVETCVLWSAISYCYK